MKTKETQSPAAPLVRALFRQLAEDRAVVQAAACVAEGYNCPNTARELRVVADHMLDQFYPQMTDHFAKYNKLVAALTETADQLEDLIEATEGLSGLDTFQQDALVNSRVVLRSVARAVIAKATETP